MNPDEQQRMGQIFSSPQQPIDRNWGSVQAAGPGVQGQNRFIVMRPDGMFNEVPDSYNPMRPTMGHAYEDPRVARQPVKLNYGSRPYQADGVSSGIRSPYFRKHQGYEMPSSYNPTDDRGYRMPLIDLSTHNQGAAPQQTKKQTSASPGMGVIQEWANAAPAQSWSKDGSERSRIADLMGQTMSGNDSARQELKAWIDSLPSGPDAGKADSSSSSSSSRAGSSSSSSSGKGTPQESQPSVSSSVSRPRGIGAGAVGNAIGSMISDVNSWHGKVPGAQGSSEKPPPEPSFNPDLGSKNIDKAAKQAAAEQLKANVKNRTDEFISLYGRPPTSKIEIDTINRQARGDLADDRGREHRFVNYLNSFDPVETFYTPEAVAREAKGLDEQARAAQQKAFGGGAIQPVPQFFKPEYFEVPRVGASLFDKGKKNRNTSPGQIAKK